MSVFAEVKVVYNIKFEKMADETVVQQTEAVAAEKEVCIGI